MNDAINSAMESLWGSLIEANVTTYATQQPARLTADGDAIPFTSLACKEFMKTYALASLCILTKQFDEAKAFALRAEDRRAAAIENLLQLTRASTSYQQATTLILMRTMLLPWLRKNPGKQLMNDAINEAIQSLWNSLVTADAGQYLSRQPDTLLNDSDPIPFDDLTCMEFLKCYALAPLSIANKAFDDATAWQGRAELKRTEVIMEVLQKSIRQENLTIYPPRTSVF
jgi:hypothetical protein